MVLVKLPAREMKISKSLARFGGEFAAIQTNHRGSLGCHDASFSSFSAKGSLGPKQTYGNRG